MQTTVGSGGQKRRAGNPNLSGNSEMCHKKRGRGQPGASFLEKFDGLPFVKKDKRISAKENAWGPRHEPPKDSECERSKTIRRKDLLPT